jgi:hypothetical protein
MVGIQKWLLQPNEEKEVIFSIEEVQDFLRLSNEDLPEGVYHWAIGESSRNLKRKLKVVND